MKQMGKAVGVMLLILASAALGASNTTRDTGTTSDAIPRANGNDGGIIMSVGPGIAVFGGNTGWSLNVGGLTQVSDINGLFVGADLGMDFWSFNTVNNPTAVSTGANALQLTPTAIYRFDISEAPGLHPYLGLSFGPNVYWSTATVNGKSTGNTTLYLETLLRPGIFTSITDTVALNVEAKLGMLGTSFVFLPNVNAYFRI